LTNKNDQVMFCGVNRGRLNGGFHPPFEDRFPHGFSRPGLAVAPDQGLSSSSRIHVFDMAILMAIYGWITHQLKF
jgi:hypothetical protein